MNNEEKVKEILECEKCHLHKTHTICDNCFDKGLLLKMADWKEQQMIEKAVLILRDEIKYHDIYEESDIETFIKRMMEE